MTDFDPNAACAPNGNYFGFPFEPDDCPLLLVSVPWDVTTSYRAGTAQGPAAIRNASVQLDFFDFEIPQAWTLGIGTWPVSASDAIEKRAADLRPAAERVIAFQEKNLEVLPAGYSESQFRKDLDCVEDGSEKTNAWLEKTCLELLAAGKHVGVVGGDHSSPFGLIKALGKRYESFGILHFDAHNDLRKAYEGFSFSHASIMYNALQLPAVSKLVQIGVRDVCQEEQDFAAGLPEKIVQFPDYRLHKSLLEGISWRNICLKIIENLPPRIYISFDIDVLEPSLCPNTGTPVPGGLSFQQVRYFFSCLRESGKEIIGFDLCEVAPNAGNPEDEWDGNTGARILYLLANTLLYSDKRIRSDR